MRGHNGRMSRIDFWCHVFVADYYTVRWGWQVKRISAGLGADLRSGTAVLAGGGSPEGRNFENEFREWQSILPHFG